MDLPDWPPPWGTFVAPCGEIIRGVVTTELTDSPLALEVSPRICGEDPSSSSAMGILPGFTEPDLKVVLAIMSDFVTAIGQGVCGAAKLLNRTE
jgi:hypothetical protein